MADPFTLTAVGSVVLTEGIKFLYGQVSDVLKRWRDHREQWAKSAAGAPVPSESAPIPVQVPPILNGTFSSPVIHFDRVAPVEADLKALVGQLATYVQGIDPIDTQDGELLARVDALRRLLEAVYGQRITFLGENRPPSGEPVVSSVIDIKQIAGVVTGIKAQSINADARTDIRSDRSEKDSTVIGIDAGTIGPPR